MTQIIRVKGITKTYGLVLQDLSKADVVALEIQEEWKAEQDEEIKE